MARPFATLILGLPLLVFPACGRKGPLEIPAGREPMAVEGLAAAQRGQAVFLEWTNPVKAVSGRPLTGLEAVEIWVFDTGLPAGGRPLASAEVEKTARLVRRISRQEFDSFEWVSGGSPGALAYMYPVVTGPSGPAKLAFTVRVFDAKGRASDFAPPVAVEIVRKTASPRTTVGKGARP
jgi:predicted small lipoprotein YifL